MKLFKIRLKTGDKVIVLAGKYKGKTGKILKIHPKDNKVTVDGNLNCLILMKFLRLKK